MKSTQRRKTDKIKTKREGQANKMREPDAVKC